MVEDRNNSADFPEDAIRRFLFGRLSALEQPAFEQCLFADDSLNARVRLAELELADDYAYGRLDNAERELFQEKFLVTADRRRKLNVSRVLRVRFASAPVETKISLADRLRPLLGFIRPGRRYAFGLVIFILLIGTVWVVVKKEPRIKEEITKRWVRKRPPVPSSPVESNHPTNKSMPEHQTSPSPMPVHNQTAPTSTASVTVPLRPAESPDGSNMPSVNLPKGEQEVVRLQLALKPDQPGPYRVELLTGDGQSVFSVEAIKAADNGSAQITFDVPARLLKTGNYQIRLGRKNATAKETLGSYYFRVQ
ncbi:MAG TPA: hypothetical protein VK582_18945 [Pyrinomonadaceae bacterium]|nr:hypothetical protein [Pyrinomonadaceae bacterium]